MYNLVVCCFIVIIVHIFQTNMYEIVKQFISLFLFVSWSRYIVSSARAHTHTIGFWKRSVCRWKIDTVGVYKNSFTYTHARARKHTHTHERALQWIDDSTDRLKESDTRDEQKKNTHMANKERFARGVLYASRPRVDVRKTLLRHKLDNK